MYNGCFKEEQGIEGNADATTGTRPAILIRSCRPHSYHKKEQTVVSRRQRKANSNNNWTKSNTIDEEYCWARSWE